MATQLRRSLYIGLGGTGMNAILKTKRMFVENYGEVPPMISFLGIDTDGGEYSKSEKTRTGEVVKLIPSEQCSISVSSPRSYYENNKDTLSWLPSENVDMIRSLDKGAGQVRTNGRLAVINNASKIATAFKSAISSIRGEFSDNEKYELLPCDRDDVHIIFSICGGTGCGTFIDFAYMLQHLYNSERRTLNINGYAILPDVFQEMVRGGNAMARVKPNAYGALQDLDFFMHLTPQSKKVSFNWISDQCQTTDKPFSSVYFIDNKNADNISYRDINNLTEMVSLALVASAGQIGTETASVGDNVEKCMVEKTLDVGNKVAWVSTIGASDVRFNGHELANIYKLKAVSRMIQFSEMSCEDGVKEANRWIDSEKVNIRESGSENDNVINFLHARSPKYSKDEITDCSAPKPEIDEYINEVVNEADESAKKKLDELSTRVISELHEEVKRLVNQGVCAVAIARETLSAINSQVVIYNDEMQNEKSELEALLPSLQSKVKVYCSDLVDCQSTFFKRGKKEKIGDLLNAVTNLATQQVEIVRRKYAIQFFNRLLGELMDEIKRVDNIHAFMKALSKMVSDELSKISSDNSNARTVEIDLATELVNDVEVRDEDITMASLKQYLPNGNMYYVEKLEQLESALMSYASSLSQYNTWKNKTIDDVINNMPEEKFERLMKRLMAKAMPFMRLDSKGMITNQEKKPIEQAINHFYYVAVPTKERSRLWINDAFVKMNDASLDIKFISTGLNDRIIIYRQDGTFPACAIGGVSSWQIDYDRSSVNCHIDANVRNRMDEEHYSLEPSKYTDDTLKYWVCGFIFGMIKYEKNTYWYYDSNAGSSLNKYWVDTCMRYRDQAYDVFQSKGKSLLRLFDDKIEEKRSAMGKDRFKELVDDVKLNYQDKYSKCPISLDVRKRELEGTFDLMERELDYVEKQFGK